MNRIDYTACTAIIISRVSLVGFLSIACDGNPASPLEIGQLSLGAAYDVHVSGTTAFVSNNEGVAILEVGDIQQPREVFTIRENSDAGTVAGFHYSGDTLLVFGDRMNVYDITTPADPTLLVYYLPRDFVSAARMGENIAYLSYLRGGLEVVDFTDSSNPISVGYADFEGQVNDLEIVEDVAFVANSSIGLEVYDISGPTSPDRIGIVAGTEGAWDIHIDGGRLYLGCHMYGVKVIDLTNVYAPVVVGTFDNGGETYGVQGLGDRLYTGDLQQGVEVLDINTPGEPLLVANDDSYHPHDLYTDGVYLYLADQDRHFVVLPLDLDTIH